VLAVACCLAIGAEIDLTTFRADSAYFSQFIWGARANGSAGGSWADTARSQSSGYGLGADIAWQMRAQGDGFDWQVGLPASAAFSRYGETETGDSVSSSRDRSHVAASLSPQLAAFGYQPGSDLFIRAGFDGDLDVARQTGITDGLQEQTTRWDVDIAGSVGPGWGRMRDAWPLLKAAWIAQVLAEDGVITSPPTEDELREVARFVSRTWKLYLAHQRPAWHYYDSLANYLDRSWGVRGGLPARTLVRLEEQLYVGNFERPFGWRARVDAVFGAELHGRREVRGDTLESEAAYEYDWQPRVLFEYARPLGTRWQFTGTLSYTPIWPDSSERHFRHSLALGGTAAWQALDRLEFGLRPGIASDLYVAAEHSYWPLSLHVSHTLGLDCSYYLAERLRLVAGANWSGRLLAAWYRRPNVHDPPPTWTNSWSLDFKLHWGPLPTNWGVRYCL
jgi:hypothetical protein